MSVKYKKTFFYQVFKKLLFIILLLMFPKKDVLLESVDEKNQDFFETIFDDDTTFFSKESLPYHKIYFITIISSLICFSTGFFLYLYNPYNISSFNFRDTTINNCHDIDILFFLLENQLSETEFLKLWEVLDQLDKVVDYKPFAIRFINNMVISSYSNNLLEDPNYVRKILIALISEIESQYY